LASQRAARSGGYALIVAAALMKFYPAAALCVVVREPRRLMLPVTLAVAAPLALFALAQHADIAVALSHVPGGDWFGDMFGAVNLPYGIALFATGLDRQVLWLAICASACVAMLALGASGAMASAQVRLPTDEATFLALGASLIVGCFFVDQSVAYRGVFLLLVLPGLAGLAAAAETRRWHAVFATTGILVVLLMWSELFRGPATEGAGLGFSFWLCRELCWWAVVIVLGSTLVTFALSSEIGRAASRVLGISYPERTWA
jgi:hypothetical protein